MRSSKKVTAKEKNRTQMKSAQVNDMVGKRYEVNDMVIKLKLHLKKREVCSRRKTNKYFYHKRKCNKEVTSNIKTGTKQIFAF